MRLLQKLSPLEIKENEIRLSSNPRMKKIDETNNEQIKADPRR